MQREISDIIKSQFDRNDSLEIARLRTIELDLSKKLDLERQNSKTQMNKATALTKRNKCH